MMPQPVPLSRDLVLVGGGHAHALVLRMWGMDPLPGARLTVIDPNPVAPYSGMLPGMVAGHYRQRDLEIDLVRLARFAGARLVVGAVCGIDAEARRITLGDGREIGYDVASVDVGVHARMPTLPGFSEHGVAVKPLGPFAARWEAFVADVAAGRQAPEAAVIGGGIAGVEVALAMAHRLRQVVGRAEVTLIERARVITPEGPVLRPRLMRALADMGVRVCTGAQVAEVQAGAVVLDGGESVPARLTVGAAGARAHDWLAETGLPVTEGGFVRVAPDLRVEGEEALFAVGDCAHHSNAPRPKAGVFAVRAAPVLRDNLRAVLSGGTTRSFHPQRDYLKLVSLGEQRAVAEKLGIAFSGRLLWRWKDRIDRAFMGKFDPLPEMRKEPPPRDRALSDEEGHEPMCGGCGAKVAPAVLRDAIVGPGDDAAVIETGGVGQVLSTDHLRAFTQDHGLMAQIAALHALGDIWAMGARPQAALVSVTLPRMSEALQARSMADIMAGARAALNPAGVEIVGGHSSMGAEASIGFSLTGIVEGAAITLGGARPGDALILTRPIGSGTLLAAEMRGEAEGRDIVALFARLAVPQGDAAAILVRARAMTDVTGFGLAGHLRNICLESRVAAWIDADAVPILPGAEALAARGVRSTIWAANRRAAPVAGLGETAREALLHDPQTAGGLLAAVEAGHANELVARLRAAGHDAALIGGIEEGMPGALRCSGAAG
ncbi:selenide, water dikinase SelD [Roseovarius sp. A46]|uniref:selenide, water dikinase SelD n=1 Tax=Roseovarius sp. A46 TaxID=2109331 RepID=UPI0010121E60|nr:selenide, water dikinase SelD [Roseovarius sp. A46]RXV64312.1 selenide, water dikinase SelD [Roseovarius sp. A46]